MIIFIRFVCNFFLLKQENCCNHSKRYKNDEKTKNPLFFHQKNKRYLEKSYKGGKVDYRFIVIVFFQCNLLSTYDMMIIDELK